MTEQPVTEEPMVVQLVAEELLVTQPMAEEPMVVQLVAEELLVAQPIAEESTVDQPVAEDPIAARRATPITKAKPSIESIKRIIVTRSRARQSTLEEESAKSRLDHGDDGSIPFEGEAKHTNIANSMAHEIVSTTASSGFENDNQDDRLFYSPAPRLSEGTMRVHEQSV
jgi:hypothetical protein